MGITGNTWYLYPTFYIHESVLFQMLKKSCKYIISGRIGIVDYDDVETSNLHRQILHTEARVGVSKAQSVVMSCKQ